MDFKEWFLSEEIRIWFENIEAAGLQQEVGDNIFKNPLMKAAMYLAYRASYDDVAKKDYEEALEKGQNAQFKPAWSMTDWMESPLGGIRAPEWTFLGKFPTQQDLQLIKQKLPEFNGNIQELADSKTVELPEVGGIAYRDQGSGFKATGLWGWNKRAKMMAVAHMVHQANEKNAQIFTGADKNLMDLIEKGKNLLPKMHAKEPDKYPSPHLDLTSPPPELTPFLYKVITQHPLAYGGGKWTGYNPDGSLNMNLGGTGMVTKFPLGNKPMWKNHIGNALKQMGIGQNEVEKLKMAMNGPSFMAMGAMQMVNQKIKEKFPDSPPLSQKAIKWLLDHADEQKSHALSM